MTNEELALLIQDGRTDLCGTLWGQVEKFVSMKANTFYRNGKEFIRCELDDLKQSGYIAMTQAIENFTPGNGKFITWFTFYLRTAFIATATGHTEKQRKDPLFFADDIDRDLYEEGGFTLEETIPGEAPDPCEAATDTVCNLELRRDLFAAMDRDLTVREKEILKAHFMEGLTLKECGKKYDITLQAVAQAKESALRKMRRKTKAFQCYLDDRTPYYMGVTIESFNADHYSPVEKLAELRETLEARYRH